LSNGLILSDQLEKQVSTACLPKLLHDISLLQFVNDNKNSFSRNDQFTNWKTKATKYKWLVDEFGPGWALLFLGKIGVKLLATLNKGVKVELQKWRKNYENPIANQDCIDFYDNWMKGDVEGCIANISM
jgi:hypothetical protein